MKAAHLWKNFSSCIQNLRTPGDERLIGLRVKVSSGVSADPRRLYNVDSCYREFDPLRCLSMAVPHSVPKSAAPAK